jgi:ubiquinone/menaquinone biosynthesis C-methylase UbiE
MTDSRLSERNQAEIERSASEAAKIVLEPLERAQIERYLNPPATTPYGLEYAFHLLGDVRGKTVVDLGCGTGENIIPLLERGARVIGMDISPDLIAIAQKRLNVANLEATLTTGDAYATGLPDESVDAIFSMALIHHLDIKLVRDEMWRVLRKGGVIILREPIRFSKAYAWVRSLLPARDDISEYEHPLTREELATMTHPFRVEGTRYFRLPFVPLVSRALPSKSDAAWRASNMILQHWAAAERYATCVATKLKKVAENNDRADGLFPSASAQRGTSYANDTLPDR